MLKLCVNCKHFNRGSRNCEAPQNMQVSLVSGLSSPKYMPADLRAFEQLCGPEGKWFEERKEQAA